MMVHHAYREAEENFQTWLTALNGAAESYLPQIRKLVEGKEPKPLGGSREHDAEIVLQNIGARIDDVMSSFDAVLRSIGMATRYEQYHKR